jgi:5'/3'-nucleotidase
VRRRRIVATNDDGIDSPGLRRLAIELAKEYDVVVAAPSGDMSGSGTGIGHFDPATGVDLVEVDIDGLTGFSIDGPPGLAVMAAALGAFGDRPDLVVSGINAGINTGHSVIHSGTVGAALTARTFRSRGLAISLDQSDPWHWDTAVDVGVSAARWLLERNGEPRVLNVNVPGLPMDEVNGIHWADLDEFGYFRVSNAALETRKLQFEVGPSSAGVDPGCDTALCAKGYVTVTPLMTVEPAPFPHTDVTAIWEPKASGFTPEHSG